MKTPSAMSKLVLFLLLLLPILSMGKDYEVKIHVQNLPTGNRPVLLKIYNGDLYMLDSIPKVSDNTISFLVPEKTLPGTIRAILGFSTFARYSNGQPTGINLLFNREDIELELDFNKPEESVKVLQSKENQIYFDFKKSDLVFFQKLRALEYVMANYPEQDEFYQKALEYYKKHQLQRNKLIEKTYSQNKQFLAGKVINTLKVPTLDGSLSPALRDSTFKVHFLETTEFNDTTLLYTHAYTDKIYQFIKMFTPRESSPREAEAGIIKALDILVPRLDANPEVQQRIMQFLINGFEANSLEEVLAHISTNYLQQCGGSKDVVKRRLAGYKKMAVGGTVPDFTAQDINNNPVNLYNTVSPYKLILFWHTECSHCQLLMEGLPKLEADLKKHSVEIIGISIDDDVEAWKKFSAKHPINWINIRVDGGFDNETAAAYNLFATPSMFLVDANNTIIAKPTTLGELEKNISEL